MGLVSNTRKELSLYISRVCIVTRNCGLLIVVSLPGIVGVLMATGRNGGGDRWVFLCDELMWGCGVSAVTMPS